MIYVVGGWAYQEVQLVTDDLEKAINVMESKTPPDKDQKHLGESGWWQMSEWDPKTGKPTGRTFELSHDGKVIIAPFSKMGINDGKDLKAAKECGALYYSPPDNLGDGLDKLILPICEAINKSEWVWTAESCQGHPDSVEGGSWNSNPSPFVRLVTHGDNLGRMLAHILKARQVVEERKLADTRAAKKLQLMEIHSIRLHPSTRPQNGFTETIIYLEAANTFQRDQALEVWAEFAEAVNR